jgi:hypothetical protein
MRKLKNWFEFMSVIITACNNADVTRYVDPNIGGVATLLTTKNPTVHRPHSIIRVFPVTKPGLGDRPNKEWAADPSIFVKMTANK